MVGRPRTHLPGRPVGTAPPAVTDGRPPPRQIRSGPAPRRRRHGRRHGRPASVVTLAVFGLVVSMSVTGRSGAVPPAARQTVVDASAWTVYHHDALGTGVAPAVTSVDTSSPAWISPTLDGQLFGEPLVASGRVYVATERDTVDALSTASGAVIWSTHVGTPVPAASLPCGDIGPTVGITGTPVVDEARGELFVVADELVAGVASHRLVGVRISDGTVETSVGVDPPGADPAALLQRTGLALDAGRVVFGFGGNYGDCGAYRGWVVSVAEDGGTPVDFAVDTGPGRQRGAIWMGGAAPAIDGTGDIWVTAGNGSVTSPADGYDDSDSTLELSSTLHLLQVFAPRSWPSDNAHDLDLSTQPALLADGQVVVSGKSAIAYLLDGSRLGGIGGEETAAPSGCTQDVDGGPATVGATVFLPCLSGPVAVAVTTAPAAVHVLWRAGAGGGPPVVAGGLVWSLGRDGSLVGLDAATGRLLQRAQVEVPANHFPTPSAGDGLLLVPGADRVTAFATRPVGGPTSGTPPRTSSLSPLPPPAGDAGGGLSPVALALAVAAVAVVAAVGIATILLVGRRRRRRSAP